jgi:hypothetical protein
MALGNQVFPLMTANRHSPEINVATIRDSNRGS